MKNSRMLSHVAMALSLFAVSATAFAADAAKDGPHAAHLLKCAGVCSDCQVECDSCFKHCLDLVASGKKEHAKSVQLCVDCAECCKTCATLCARNSPLAKHMQECCALCCDECATECEKAPDDKRMAACAKSCRNCAKDCRDMAKMLK